MGWKEDARRMIVSEKKELQTFPGRWVKVRKYSIRGKDEINAAMAKLQQGLDKKAIYSLAKKIREQQGNKSLTEQEALALLEPDEIAAFMDGNTAPAEDLSRLRILHGVAAHNFLDGDPEAVQIGTSKQEDIKTFSSEILEFSEATAEILSLVEDFNRPLARPRSKTSETSPSGSGTAQPSSPETSSQTEGMQPS